MEESGNTEQDGHRLRHGHAQSVSPLYLTPLSFSTDIIFSQHSLVSPSTQRRSPPSERSAASKPSTPQTSSPSTTPPAPPPSPLPTGLKLTASSTSCTSSRRKALIHLSRTLLSVRPLFPQPFVVTTPPEFESFPSETMQPTPMDGLQQTQLPPNTPSTPTFLRSGTGRVSRRPRQPPRSLRRHLFSYTTFSHKWRENHSPRNTVRPSVFVFFTPQTGEADCGVSSFPARQMVTRVGEPASLVTPCPSWLTNIYPLQSSSYRSWGAHSSGVQVRGSPQRVVRLAHGLPGQAAIALLPAQKVSPLPTLFSILSGEVTNAAASISRDFFPWIYWVSFVKGTWFGATGFLRPAAK